MPAVSAVISLRLLTGGRQFPAWARFSYDPGDPYEVRVVFRAGLAPPAEWVFARALLTDGLHGPAGAGDVRVWPARGGLVVIGLSAPAGTAQFEAPAADVARFLDATRRLIADGAEPARTDIDAGINAILTEHGPR